MKRRLRLWRRRWCIRRGHAMADWSPVCIEYRGTDGQVIQERAWRCATHDRVPA